MVKVIKFATYLDVQIQEIRLQRSKKKTRMRLLSAMAKMLETMPHHEIMVDDVCKFSDLGRGTFYLYFDSIESLQLELLQEYVAFEAHAMPLVTQKNDWFDYLLDVVEWYERTLIINFALIRTLLQLAAANDNFSKLWEKRNKEIVDRIQPRLAELLDFPQEYSEIFRDAMRGAGAVMDQRLFQSYVFGTEETSQSEEQSRYFIELHALMMYRAVMGVDPANAEERLPRVKPLIQFTENR